MKAVAGRKITVPGNFKSNSSLACMACSYKAQSGVLFPLERGFMYLHKPPMHIRFDEIDNVNFARESTKLRSFEFHVQTKQGQKHIFGTIDRAEYNCFFDFVKQKRLKIRNINKHEQQRVENFSDSSGGNFKPPSSDSYLLLRRISRSLREQTQGRSAGHGGWRLRIRWFRFRSRFKSSPLGCFLICF